MAEAQRGLVLSFMSTVVIEYDLWTRMFLIPISSQPETHKVAYASSYLFYHRSKWHIAE